jgi:superfamily I DNA/RNA helicase
MSQTHRDVDILIIDEAQDFGANQLRAAFFHCNAEASVSIVMDTAQRIYTRGFTWLELGVERVSTHHLQVNYRNTRQIASFAAAVLAGLKPDDEFSMPDFNSCKSSGELPTLIVANFSLQLTSIRKLLTVARERDESVGFLYPYGGGWQRALREYLESEKIAYAEITREDEWPDGDEIVALSTIYSSKGLEFDHVVMLGLDSETLSLREEDGEDKSDRQRRLVAMAVGRARKSVTIGHAPGRRPAVLRAVPSELFHEVIL